jgi:hypothetical protein
MTSEGLIGDGTGDRLCISKLTSFMTDDMIDELALAFRFLGVAVLCKLGSTETIDSGAVCRVGDEVTGLNGPMVSQAFGFFFMGAQHFPGIAYQRVG